MEQKTVPMVEDVLDKFLKNDPELDEDEFSAECGLDPTDGHVSAEARLMEQEALRRKYARDMKHIGDDLTKKYEKETKKSPLREVKQFFEQNMRQAGKTPDELWDSYKNMMDNMLQTAGLGDESKMLSMVFVTVKGLMYIGDGVRDMTLKYIREKNLAKDMDKMQAAKPQDLD